MECNGIKDLVDHIITYHIGVKTKSPCEKLKKRNRAKSQYTFVNGDNVIVNENHFQNDTNFTNIYEHILVNDRLCVLLKDVGNGLLDRMG